MGNALRLVVLLLGIVAVEQAYAAGICASGRALRITSHEFVGGSGAVEDSIRLPVGHYAWHLEEIFYPTTIYRGHNGGACQGGHRRDLPASFPLTSGPTPSGSPVGVARVRATHSGSLITICTGNGDWHTSHSHGDWRADGVCEPPPCPLGQQQINGQCIDPFKDLGNSCSISGGDGGGGAFAGNPINLSNGNKFQQETDYVNARNPLLSLSRYYNSHVSAAPGSFGAKWRSSFDRRIESLPGIGPGGADIARVARPEGKIFRFVKTGGVWIPDRDVSYTLQQTAQGWLLLTPGDVTETYDAQGRLQSMHSREGRTVTLAYNTAGLLSTVTDDFSRVLAWTYDSARRAETLTTPGGEVYVYRYNSAGALQAVVLPDDTPTVATDNPTRSYHYEDARFRSHLTGITDEAGNRFATWAYDAQGRGISSERAGGAGKTNITYQADGSTDVAEWVDATRSANRSYLFTVVEGALKLSSITGAACQSCGAAGGITYDTNGFVASRTAFNDNLTTYIRDTRGQELSRTEASGTSQARTISTQWHAQYRLPVQVDEPGRHAVYTYDAQGRRTSETVTDSSSLSRTTTYTYNAQGLVETVDGPRTDASDLATYAYDAQGNLTQITNALGHVTLITAHDPHGNPLRIVDPNGVETLLAYDARQRLILRTTGGLATVLAYDAAGQLTKITQPDGSFLEYDYDAAHRLTDIRDQEGNHIQYTLDLAGNRTAEAVHDPAGSLRRSQTRVYDTLSRLKEIRGAQGQVQHYEYDDNGNPIQTTVDGSRVTQQGYDALDRLITVIDAAQGQTRYEYNALDHLTSVTDPQGLVTTYTVNAFGDVTELQSPDSGTTSSTYDSTGNLATRTDAKGQTTTYSYDALNRLTQAAHPGGSTVTYTYDQGTYGKGRLTGISDSSGSTSWAYNAQGRITSKTQIAGSQTLTTAYGYDAAGRLISQTLPSGKVVGLSWTGQQITGVTLNGQPLAANITHEPFGPIAQWDFANGQQVIRSYDLSGRMSSHSLGSIGYDTADRITSLSHGGLSFLGGSKTYGYDALDRLTGYSGSGVSIGYSYDANGNRLQQTSGVGTVTSAIDSASNRLTALTGGGGTQSYSYDANGSLLSDGLNSYGYDSAGRLVTANGASYAYNGLGQRTVKTVGGTSTVFVYDEQGHLQGEYDASGTPIQETVWLGDTPIAVLKSSDTYYIHADHLNTPRQIEDQSGDTVWLWDTITFGASTPEEDPRNTGTPFTYNLRHPGQYFDQETGLFQNWWRDYSPLGGRYIQSDPIGLFGGINTYAYADLNPLSKSDPTGLCPVCPVLIPPAIAAGAMVMAGAALNDPIVVDPTRPAIPQLPGYVDPWSDSVKTEQTCEIPNKPPLDPRQRCMNGVNLRYLQCLARHPGAPGFAYCGAQRIFGLALCNAKSGEGDD